MRLSVATTAAFAVSGAGWLAGSALVNEELVSPVLSPLFPVALYVVLGSLVLGIRSDRLVSTLVGLWLTSVALVSALLSGAGGPFDSLLLDLYLMLVYGLISGTAAFVAWVAFGLIGLRLLGRLPDPAVAAHRR